ncbi:hypothetical protein ACJX0J_033873, partial [Zea mays]
DATTSALPAAHVVLRLLKQYPIENNVEAIAVPNIFILQRAYKFIVAVVIWYEVLYAVNLVSKQMQAKDMLIDVAIEKVHYKIINGFIKAITEDNYKNIK